VSEIILIADEGTYGEYTLKIAEKCAPFVDRIWLRIKGKSEKETARTAEEFRKTLPNKFLILSENPGIAHKTGFQAVHLGRFTMPERPVKESFSELITGYSAHSIEEIKNTDADYFTLSPIFFTKKTYEVIPLGPLNINDIGKTVFALGGINACNISQLKDKGYAGIAGIGFAKDIENIKEEADRL